MLTSLRSRRRRSLEEGGFTLIEVMVALAILLIVAGGLVPLLVIGAKTANLSALETIAKNLAQQRLEQMRNLPYYVAHQNGDFVDLLDEYYTNVSTTPTPIPPTGGTGTYQTGTGAGGTPTGPYYQVSFPDVPGFTDSGQTIPGFTNYTETVDSQFIVPNTTPSTPVTPPSTYNSQASVVDSPPSLYLGVTVFVSFSIYGGPHTARYYTEISGQGNDVNLVLAQAGATAVTINSTAYDGSTLSATLGSVGANGTLSNNSQASAQASAASFTQVSTDGTTGSSCPTGVESCAYGQQGTAVAPPDSGSTGETDLLQQEQTDTAESPCGWGAFGPTFVDDVSASVDSSQPLAPSDVESGASPTPTVSAGLKPQTSGACSGLYFTNVLAGSPATSSSLDLVAGQPIVAIPNATGNANVVTAAGNVNTPALPFSGTRPPVTSSASVAFTQPVELFPGLPLAADGQPLVTVQISSASLSCASNAETASASYALTYSYWSQSTPSNGTRVTTTVDWSTGDAAPTLPPLATTYVGYANGAPVPLSTYLSAWSLAGSVVEQTSGSSTVNVGVHTIPDIFSATTVPIMPSAETYGSQTQVSVSLGQLTCVAEDNR